MAERINDDEDKHSDVQWRIPRVLLVIQAITLILNIVWLACVAVVPIVIKAYFSILPTSGYIKKPERRLHGV